MSYPSESYDEKTSVDEYTIWHCNKKVLLWEGEHSFLFVCWFERMVFPLFMSLVDFSIMDVFDYLGKKGKEEVLNC